MCVGSLSTTPLTGAQELPRRKLAPQRCRSDGDGFALVPFSAKNSAWVEFVLLLCLPESPVTHRERPPAS
jgi:hypothetical protein